LHLVGNAQNHIGMTWFIQTAPTRQILTPQIMMGNNGKLKASPSINIVAIPAFLAKTV
jgi:hypothetical protein